MSGNQSALEPKPGINRRAFLQTTTALAAGAGLSSSAFGQMCPPKSGTVRDRIWIFANPVNADFNYVRKRSVMSPLEAAVYMGAPNLLMVNQYPGSNEHNVYKAWEPPIEQYAYPLKVLKRVVWSIVGASGITKDEERQEVLKLAHEISNIVGVFMDDFFHDNPAENKGSLSLDQLQEIQRQLKGPAKKLDLYVTLYTRQVTPAIQEYLKLIDVITLWTWETAQIANLEANLTRLEKLAPHSRKLLGCYTAEYDQKRTPWWTPMPVPLMQKQCETGLRWLRQGRIEGIIIYGTAMDLNWPSVEWARSWIQKVGDIKLPP